MQTENVLDVNYWNTRYQEKQTGWDLKQVSPPLKAYIDQLVEKDIPILIPGCGNAYEATYLAEAGFNNITIIDIAPLLVEELKNKLRNYASIRIIEVDFFEHEGNYGLILEQTFFCAIHPTLRAQYVQKMHSLLLNNGKLVGLLFDTLFEKEGPPFGGTAKNYRLQFEPYFHFTYFDPCYNSFYKREGTELFINLIKK